MLILQGAISLGLIFSLMAMGVYLAFRVLEMPDLSVEGSIILGAAMAAMLVTRGVNPFLATFLSMLTGSAAGLTTGVVHTKLKIPSILAGILTMVASYSVVIRIMGTSNVALLPHGPNRVVSIYTFLSESAFFVNTFDSPRQAAILALTAVIVLVVGVLLYCFLGTELGSSIRATGNNRQMVKAQGINTHAMIITCLAVSNGLVGLSGALWAQQQGFTSVDMGAGTIVVGLASLIIAEVIFPVRNVWTRLISIVIGSIIYRLIIALALDIGFMRPTDLRLLTAVIVAIALSLPLIRDKFIKKFKKTKEQRGDG